MGVQQERLVFNQEEGEEVVHENDSREGEVQGEGHGDVALDYPPSEPLLQWLQNALGTASTPSQKASTGPV